jgi:hypothetical protein
MGACYTAQATVPTRKHRMLNRQRLIILVLSLMEMKSETIASNVQNVPLPRKLRKITQATGTEA